MNASSPPFIRALAAASPMETFKYTREGEEGKGKEGKWDTERGQKSCERNGPHEADRERGEGEKNARMNPIIVLPRAS